MTLKMNLRSLVQLITTENTNLEIIKVQVV